MNMNINMSSKMETLNDVVGERDRLYAIDCSRLEAVREQKAWMQDPKYFKKVVCSPSSIIKMLSHGQTGCDKGIQKSGKPIEVMGLLVGRPDTKDTDTLIISDAQPLPIEGFETRVIADDDTVINYMIELGETNELMKKDKFCGWYHTHPFDLDVSNNCFLSNTDVSTQLQWQRAEDPHGNPWVAIVIDPLRSVRDGRPHLKAFRAFPPDYTPPMNETPDGTIVPDEKMRVEKWGACWNRYYELSVSFYLSTLAQTTLSILKNNFLWQNSMSSSLNHKTEHQRQVTDKMDTCSDNLDLAGGRPAVSGGWASTVASASSFIKTEVAMAGAVGEVPLFEKASQAGGDAALDKCRGCMSQIVKRYLFVRANKESQLSS